MQFERFSDKIKRDKRTNGDVMVGGSCILNEEKLLAESMSFGHSYLCIRTPEPKLVRI